MLEIVCALTGGLGSRKGISALQIGFSAAFDRVSHFELLFKVRDVEVGSGFFNIITICLNGRVQGVVDDGVRSEDVRLISDV